KFTLCPAGVLAFVIHRSLTNCWSFHFPLLRNNNPKRAISSVLMNNPAPECPPPVTDFICNPSITVHAWSYPYHRHVGVAPMLSMICSFKTMGKGFLHTWVRE